MRKIQHLNFSWRFADDFKEEYTQKDFDVSEWEIIDIPHNTVDIPFNNFDETVYQKESCYILDFVPDPELAERVFLNFEAVMAYAKVFLNGDYIGEHKGGYTPFRFDVSDRLIREISNRLTVFVDSSERSEIPPFGFVLDYLSYGGIYREVSLLGTASIALDDVFIKAKGGGQHWILETLIEISSGGRDSLAITVELMDDDYCPVLSYTEPLKSGELNPELSFAVDSPRLWHPDSPDLYLLRTSLLVEGQLIDQREDRFGFRTVEIGKDGLKINGNSFKIRGLNRHQSFPYIGYAMPASAQRRDVEILKKELGVNTVRSSHYPPSRHFLDACDESGLLVFNEIPGWQHIGNEKEWHDITCQHVEEMIKRDRNHPSVFIWGVRINESQDNDALYKRTNQLAKALDNTRPTGGVRNFSKSRLLEDVYTYNDFIHQGDNRALDNRALDNPGKISGGKYPYLVTEHNGHMFPVKKNDQEDRRVEHALRHLRVMNAAYGKKKNSGAIGWCMFDYNTHRDFGSGDRICYHGVMDMFRLPKTAASAYASQQEDFPFGYVTSEMQMGEKNASIQGEVFVMTNSDEVRFYRNNQLIGSFFPDRKGFPHLPHPPIVIDDFIGDRIEQEEKWSLRDKRRIQRVFKCMSLQGKAKLWQYPGVLISMIKNGLKIRDMYDLYLKYVGNWGAESVEYRFEGYRRGIQEWICVKAPAAKSYLSICPDSETLVESDTWDTSRVVVECRDENGNLRQQAFDALKIEVSGGGSLIGPELIHLTAGSTAFWVRTNGQSGNIFIKVISANREVQEIYLKVEKNKNKTSFC